jgi:dTDP-4-amino-4,6-dideoxygalactose transaminase
VCSSDLLQRLRSHGITRQTGEMQARDEGAWYYEQLELGYNYRITDIQAALGLSQLQRLEQFVQRRRELAARYDERLSHLPLTRPAQRGFGASAFHLYPVWFDENLTGKNRRAIFDALRTQGIGVNVHYIPIHLQPDYRRLGFEPGQFPAAEHYYSGAISLPLFHAMTNNQQDQVIAALENVLA